MFFAFADDVKLGILFIQNIEQDPTKKNDKNIKTPQKHATFFEMSFSLFNYNIEIEFLNGSDPPLKLKRFC